MRLLPAIYATTCITIFAFSSFSQAKNSFNSPRYLHENDATVGITHELNGQNLSN